MDIHSETVRQRIGRLWHSRVRKVVQVVATAIGFYLAYTGITGRELLWEIGPGYVGDLTAYLTDVSPSDVGRTVLIALGVAVLAIAWGPSAYRNLRDFREAIPGQVEWRSDAAEMTPGQRAHLEEAEKRRDAYLSRGLKRHAREVNKQMRLARDHWWGDAPPVEPPTDAQVSARRAAIVAQLQKPSAPPVVGDLLMEGNELMEDLLAARRQKTTHPFGLRPGVASVAGRVRDWNERVARVVDSSSLSFNEKMSLAIYSEPSFSTAIAGPSAEKVAAVIENNMRLLARLT